MITINQIDIKNILGRNENIFHTKNSNFFKNYKILILGAAGSISTAFINKLQSYDFFQLILVDKNENDLTKLSRKIDISVKNKCIFLCCDINNINSSFYKRFKKNDKIIILNFAALKHVRSEVYNESLMNMFQTNILSPFIIFDKISKITKVDLFFSISTDKAANPMNYMGASKRLSEYFLSFMKKKYPNTTITSTRFPNVLFSKGSISESIVENTINRELFGIPKNIKRFFISENEATSIIFESLDNEFDNFISFPTVKLYGKSIDILVLAKRITKSIKCKIKIISNLDTFHRIKQNKYIAYILLTSKTTGEKNIEKFYSNKEKIYKTNNIYLNKIKLPNNKKINKHFEVLLKQKSVSENTYLKLVTLLDEFKYTKKDKNLFQIK